ncbi:hypothetical protein KPL71_014461 [Citrus sinensis]|uniref:Uncharacterized protein n=1 Tax=Citrus sinensis TaxID=2711 RepID=A0ACB8KBW6_CITSI|nr:hypothetical protein KPL71_014461 [Citrus sinensis]
MAHALVSSLLDQLNSIAQEKWRLVTGVEQEVGKLTTNLQAIQAVVEDAEQRQMKQDKAVTFWLDQLRDASYDMEDVLEEWITETRKLQLDEGGDDDDDDDNDSAFVTFLTKVCSFFPAASNCFGGFKQLSLRHHIAVKIREISKRLDEIATRKDRFNFVENVSNNVRNPERVRTISLIDEGEVCGRVEEKNELLSKLLCESSEQQKGLHVISLVGLGGIGKTTLAQLAYNNDEVKRNFGKVIWVCVSYTFEEIRVAKAIIEDDVWDGDYKKWDPFFSCLKNGHHESKILITTRDRSFEDCEKLEPIGRKIACKCKGLPLAAKVIGNLLRSKSTVKEWQRILESEMWKIEEIGQGILAPLLLSYNDLPSNSMVKRCFSYCSVFPKDYNMNKRELINLWMAQGYLNADEDEEMETIGEEYFNILTTRSFFQEFQKNDDDDIMSCKMHEIVHDFAQFVSSKECLWLEINGSHPEANWIREIPENVGKLIHLKYLNLSEVVIERLPETLCELYNLQKLDIRLCRNLRELPEGIGKLMNMRSLLNAETRSLKYMPIGISKLTSLRTLEKFVVGGGVDGGSTCRLESLKNLQLLRECRVQGLSNVSHVDEAERLQLYNKKNLLRLGLQFGRVVDGEGEEGRRKNIEKDKQLLEALQPPLNVEKLWIVYYGGNILPKWLTSLTNLRELKLLSCVNCEHLPPLGKLPLEKLELYNLKSVKRVGNEFLGIEESSEDGPSSSSSSPSVIAFPKLKSLIIEELDELEEWNYRITRKENISIMPQRGKEKTGIRYLTFPTSRCHPTVECDLQGFEKVFAVKFAPQAIAAKRHIHLRNSVSDFLGMYSKATEQSTRGLITCFHGGRNSVLTLLCRLPWYVEYHLRGFVRAFAVKLPARAIAHSSSTILDFQGPLTVFTHVSMLVVITISYLAPLRCITFETAFAVKFQCLYNGREEVKDTKQLIKANVRMKIVHHTWHVEYHLQGFQKVFAVKFQPIAVKRHIHLSNSVSDFQGVELSELSEEDGVSQTKYKKISHIPHMVSMHRLPVTIPSVSTKAPGYGAFIGLYANMRYQLLCGFDRAVTNHFDVIAVALFLSTTSSPSQDVMAQLKSPQVVDTKECHCFWAWAPLASNKIVRRKVTA